MSAARPADTIREAGIDPGIDPGGGAGRTARPGRAARRHRPTAAARRTARAAALAGLVVLALTLLPGCSGSGADGTPHPAPGPFPSAARSTPTADPDALPPGRRLVAMAIRPQIEVFGSPGDPEPRWRLANPNAQGVAVVFAVLRRTGDWLRVQVPVRPNGSEGWIRADDVRLGVTPYALTVDRSDHLLTVRRDSEVVARIPVGIGTGQTPTPSGHFYLTELLRPADPGGPWGPFAYGLSGFSDVVTEFNGAEGIIGLHGTNRPDLVGGDVSMGCIRMRNEDIENLVKIVPLGTPITITS